MENTAEDKNQSPVVGPELLDAVRRQIEYYFSKENLQNDKYLASQMDAHMSVPISLILKFAKLKALTQDEEVVKQALVDSSVTVVDNKIKANIKAAGRSTIILRDIPTDATEEEVREIFNFPDCKNICSVRSDIEDTWFVVMDTEDDAKDTVIALRVNKRTFRGKSVKARVKTEAVVRSYYPTNVAAVTAPMAYPVMPFAPMMDGMMVHPYYMPIPPVMDPNAPLAEDGEGAEDSTADPNGRKAGVFRDHKGKVKTDRTTRRTNSEGGVNSSSVGARRPAGREREGVREKKAGDEAPVKPPIEVNALTFPPLGVVDERPVPTPGYKGPFQKYSIDDIIMIVKSVKEATLPADLNPKDHLVAMMPEINMDLLKRQRTFTIDETREQLRLGRPVQREAILPGAVDYRSMMYGDSEFSAPAPKAEPTPVLEEPKKKEATAPAPIEEPRRDVTSPSTVQAAPAPAPVSSSPARISAATWAAMVRSAANEPVVAAAPKPTPVAAATAPKAPSTPSRAAKSSSDKPTAVESDKEKDGKTKDSKKKKETKEKVGKEEAATSAESSAQVTAVESEHKPAAEGALPPAPTWGGKISFANVLKQAGAEGDVLAAKPPQVPADSRPKTEAKPAAAAVKTPGNGVYTNSKPRAVPTVPATTSAAKGEKKSNADSDGMWVKERLPEVSEK